MLSAPDNQVFFDLWSVDEITCACIELYYNDPPTADFHNHVIRGAVVLLGETGDPRAVPVLIDAIDTHGPQALYALGNYSTVEALNALVDNIRNDDPSNRENAAEGLRRMQAPSDGIPDGWVQALETAADKVGEWMAIEPDSSLKGYFVDAHTKLKKLLEQARAVQGE
jgi:HEAT repeat protein